MKQDRPSRMAIRAEDTPPALIDALAKADYSHLPTLELSAEYLDAIQRDIDAKLGPVKFRKSVSRAGW